MILLSIIGIIIPFVGTALGAAPVYFINKKPNETFCGVLNGFAAGVMTAASIWSLILPAVDGSAKLGSFAFFPPFVGLWSGVAFLLIVEFSAKKAETGGSRRNLLTVDQKTRMMIFAVTLHNAPEGLAVGIVFAGLISGEVGVTLAGAMALSLGIAIQNIPEGAIVSLPLRSSGYGKTRSFLFGVLSGVIEPIAALFAILFAWFVKDLMPYFLGFAAGAMICVVVKDLIKDAIGNERETLGTLAFFLGFTLMMALDVALG